MTRFAGRRGISMIVVVILTIVTILMTAVSLVLYFRWIDYERLQKDLIKQLDRENTEKDLIAATIPKHIFGSGLTTGDKIEPKELTSAKPKSEYEKQMGLLLGTGDGGDERVKKAKEARLYPTLQSLVEIAAANFQSNCNKMKSLQLELDIAKGRADNRERVKPDMPKKKNEFITEMQEKIARLNQQIADENNTYNTRKTELTTLRDDSARLSEEETTAFYNWEIKIKNEIRELQRQLEELKVKEIIKVDISQSHGRILRPDIPNKMAFIDIGSRERVVPGLKFLVARRGNQGRFEYKAEIVVKKVWMTYAEVGITRVYGTELPVIEGDLIVNPLFSKHRAIIVAFAGEERPLRVRPAWSTDEATRRITEIGSVVRKEPDLDVDFVIWTEAGLSSGAIKPQNQYKEFAKAQLLEIPIADASEMYRFLGE